MLRYIRTRDEWPDDDPDEPNTPGPVRPAIARPRPYAALLRQELTARASAWAATNGVPFVCSTGQSRAVLFEADPAGGHGNFFPASYRRIQADPEWRKRLDKTHTTARRFLVSHDVGRRELDAATSSDALLMSLFCHPQALSGAQSSLRRLMGIDAVEQFDFGYKPRVPWDTAHVERTEVDLRIAHAGGELLLEAKLTEADFQTIPRSRLMRYLGATTAGQDSASAAFDLDALDATDSGRTRLLHGQLLRGVLSAHAVPGRRYALTCDARRPDLIESWYSVLRGVRSSELRSRLVLLTWQEIVATLPLTVQVWAEAKYGIVRAA